MKNSLIAFLLAAFLPAAAQDFKLEKLPDLINSSYDEITPVPSRDGKTLYFTRVGYPDFDQTLFIDSVDQARQRSPEQYMTLLSDIYSQMAGTGIYAPTRSSYNQDVWSVQVDSTNFSTPVHPRYPLNNALPNSLVSITPDPNVFYTINQFDPRGNMQRGFSTIRRLTDST